MSIQDKYKWNVQKLQGQLWARGLTQKVMDLHNDALEALAIEMAVDIGQQSGGDLEQVDESEFDSIWTEVINMEAGYRELQKELNILKQDVSDIENDSKRKGTKTK